MASFRFNHSEVDLTGVLGDGVASEVSALSKTVWLVAESLLAAAFLLVNDDFALVSCGLGDENGLAVAALKVSAHGCACLVGAAGNFEFVA